MHSTTVCLKHTKAFHSIDGYAAFDAIDSLPSQLAEHNVLTRTLCCKDTTDLLQRYKRLDEFVIEGLKGTTDLMRVHCRGHSRRN